MDYRWFDLDRDTRTTDFRIDRESYETISGSIEEKKSKGRIFRRRLFRLLAPFVLAFLGRSLPQDRKVFFCPSDNATCEGFEDETQGLQNMVVKMIVIFFWLPKVSYALC